LRSHYHRRSATDLQNLRPFEPDVFARAIFSGDHERL
jgi:hypothetical protein